MSYQSFNPKDVDQLSQNMFFGEGVNIARYDQQRHPIFEKLIEKQIGFFWRPEEVDLSRDRIDFQKLTEAERHLFISNLKYQILLDSVQGRSPNVAFLPIVSLPELETWIETWSFFETIHSRSYTHIIRNIMNAPEDVFGNIVNVKEIRERAHDVSKYYDDLILAVNHLQSRGEGLLVIDGKEFDTRPRAMKKRLYLCMNSVNALEAVRFYVSFACTFAFSERKLMEGNGKIVRLIARDEAVHLTSTQHILNLWASGKDDPEMAEIAAECREEARQIFISAVEQEKLWADYLFSKGSMIGLNANILKDYVEWIATQRMGAIGMESPYTVNSNPLPWMNQYLHSDNVQVAPQESEISSYLVGAVDSNVSKDDFADMEI